jgi:hypothetical protein
MTDPERKQQSMIVQKAKKAAKDTADVIYPSADPLRLLESTVRLAANSAALKLWRTAERIAYMAVAKPNGDPVVAIGNMVAEERSKILKSVASQESGHGLLEQALESAVRRQVLTTIQDILDCSSMEEWAAKA